MKVLVIDSDKFAQTVYESEFHQENIEVIVVENGQEGYAAAVKEMPDLILLELILTKKNGFELIRELKANPKLKNIPVVVCSSLSQKADIDESVSLGALKYYSKDNYSLKQVVREVMKIMSASA